MPLWALRPGWPLSLPDRMAPAHFPTDTSGMRVSSHQYIEDQFPRKLNLTMFVLEGVFTPGPGVTA